MPRRAPSIRALANTALVLGASFVAAAEVRAEPMVGLEAQVFAGPEGQAVDAERGYGVGLRLGWGIALGRFLRLAPEARLVVSSLSDSSLENGSGLWSARLGARLEGTPPGADWFTSGVYAHAGRSFLASAREAGSEDARAPSYEDVGGFGYDVGGFVVFEVNAPFWVGFYGGYTRTGVQLSVGARRSAEVDATVHGAEIGAYWELRF